LAGNTGIKFFAAKFVEGSLSLEFSDKSQSIAIQNLISRCQKLVVITASRISLRKTRPSAIAQTKPQSILDLTQIRSHIRLTHVQHRLRAGKPLPQLLAKVPTKHQRCSARERAVPATFPKATLQVTMTRVLRPWRCFSANCFRRLRLCIEAHTRIPAFLNHASDPNQLNPTL
jgi:hypothetical protein